MFPRALPSNFLYSFKMWANLLGIPTDVQHKNLMIKCHRPEASEMFPRAVLSNFFTLWFLFEIWADFWGYQQTSSIKCHRSEALPDVVKDIAIQFSVLFSSNAELRLLLFNNCNLREMHFYILPRKPPLLHWRLKKSLKWYQLLDISASWQSEMVWKCTV